MASQAGVAQIQHFEPARSPELPSASPHGRPANTVSTSSSVPGRWQRRRLYRSFRAQRRTRASIFAYRQRGGCCCCRCKERGPRNENENEMHMPNGGRRAGARSRKQGSRSGEERELRAEEEEARGWKEAYTCAAREEGAAISKFDEVRSEKDGVRRGGAV